MVPDLIFVLARATLVYMTFVTVFRAFNPAEAELVQSRLDAAGFTVNVANELSALSIEGYAMAAGGILVQVPDTEAADARALIESKDPS
jgi:hypothetical protein